MDTKGKLRNYALLTLGQTASQFGTSMSGFAISVWSYSRYGNALSFSLLAVCGLVPHIVVGLFGGSIIDRYGKKGIMLLCDTVAALGTLAVLVCSSLDRLNLGLLCAVNVLSGFMNAFQKPASAVVTTLLMPEAHYVRIGGIQTTLSSMVSIFVPIAAGAALAIGGLPAVLLLDLGTFLFASCTLIFFIKIPEPRRQRLPIQVTGVFAESRATYTFLMREQRLLMLFIIYACLNFFAAISFDGLMQPLILARTGNDAVAVGAISSAMAVSQMVAGLCILLIKPGRRMTSVMFAGILTAFAGIAAFGLARNTVQWAVVVSVGCFGMPFYFSYEGALIRRITPVEMQGRVYALKEMLTQGLTLLGYVGGALLADCVFEPFMQAEGTMQVGLQRIFGSGKGSGMSMMCFGCGALGLLVTLALRRNRSVQGLDEL